MHSELETFLKRSHAKLATQLDEWSDKFDQDNEAKQQELEKMRDKRAQDLARLQDLTETYNEYDRVVAQDRKKKLKMQEDAQRLVCNIKEEKRKSVCTKERLCVCVCV